MHGLCELYLLMVITVDNHWLQMVIGGQVLMKWEKLNFYANFLMYLVVRLENLGYLPVYQCN